MRYLTGFTLADGEEKVAGSSGTVPALRGAAHPVRGLALRDPGLAGGARGLDRDRVRRPADALAGARRVGGREARRGRGGLRATGDLDEAGGRRTRCRAGTDRGLDRGRPGDEGALGARAGRSGVRGRRQGARRAAPGDPARHDRGRARASPRVVDADRRRRGAGLRGRMSGGPGGGSAARSTRRSPCPRGCGPPLRLRRPGRRLSQRHDADPVRRRPIGA